MSGPVRCGEAYVCDIRDEVLVAIRVQRMGLWVCVGGE